MFRIFEAQVGGFVSPHTRVARVGVEHGGTPPVFSVLAFARVWVEGDGMCNGLGGFCRNAIFVTLLQS